MKIVLAVIVFCIGWISPATAQTYKVTGKVQDEKGKPLPFASAFLSQTTLGDRTTEAGDFTIKGVPPGKYDLIVSYLGYEPLLVPVTVTNDLAGVVAVLKPKAGVLKEVVVRRNAERDRLMNIFKSIWVGRSGNAEQCTILNDEVIDLVNDENKGILKATSDDFIVLENRALGYRVKFLLMHFEYQRYSGYSLYYGNPLFELMKPRNARQQRNWEKKRIEAYNGSSMHFYRSLVNKTLREDGFLVQKMVRVEKKRDFVAPTGIDTTKDIKIKSDGMFSKYVNYLYPGQVPYDSLITDNNGTKSLIFGNYLFITYTKEKEERKYMQYYDYPQNAKPGPQISYLRLLAPAVNVDGNGNVESPTDLIVEQYWGWEKMAEMLPLDFKIINTNSKK
jgi:hypothetical protein